MAKILCSVKQAASLAATGQFCTIEFIKKDGSIRKLNGRANVKKYLQGGKNNSPAYLKLWVRDGEKYFNACRNISPDKIISIKAHGVVIQRNDFSDYAKFV